MKNMQTVQAPIVLNIYDEQRGYTEEAEICNL